MLISVGVRVSFWLVSVVSVTVNGVVPEAPTRRPRIPERLPSLLSAVFAPGACRRFLFCHILPPRPLRNGLGYVFGSFYQAQKGSIYFT